MNIHFSLWYLLTVISLSSAERWRWPDGAESIRIDTKVRFIDGNPSQDKNKIDSRAQANEVPFQEPTDTAGFYNRPMNSGRYPVRIGEHESNFRVNGETVYPVRNSYGQHRPSHHESDGTLDSLAFCKCVSTPECKTRTDIHNACGAGKHLCCYKRPNKNNEKSEIFNEIEDERPLLLPNQETAVGPFSLPNSEVNGLFGPGHAHETALVGRIETSRRPDVLIGPDGPTGIIGPTKRPILVGPEGPTGTIGPKQQNQGVLIGPGGPTGIIGPKQQNQGVLVGPGGPTGIIGPAPGSNYEHRPDRTEGEISSSETAQRGVLVGPGGPTGIIGPGGGYNQRPVLVGPGGPTGLIGPGRPGRRQGVLIGPGGPTGIIGPGYGRQLSRPGILVGPGGPTGIIGPGRQILVGPGGPTGHIGPIRDFGK